MVRALVLVLLASFLLAGCGAEMHRATKAMPSSDQSFETTKSTAGAASPVAGAAGGDAVLGPESSTPVQRRVIYNGSINLVVDSLQGMDEKIKKLVGEHEGKVASYREDRTYGDRRSASWTLRVPSTSFDAVLNAIANLGVPESTNVDSEDVTEQFVDLEARLSNKKRLETELLKLLDEREGELKDVIAVKQELSGVREEIERIEGRLRYLRDRVELSTITVAAREDRDYRPKQAPTFTARIGDSWSGSLHSMRRFGENAVIAAVAAAPWLGVLAILVLPLIAWRRARAARSMR
jgi:hypothetical protein